MALNPVSIPLIITKDQKQQLLDLGYKKSQINKMKPEEAHEILGIKPDLELPIFTDIAGEIPEKFQPPDSVIQIPSKPDAEKSLIGALLFNQSKELWDSVIPELNPGHMHIESHQKIYQVMVDLYEKDEIPNPITVIDALRRSRQISKVGGEAFVSSLVSDQYRRSSLTGEIRLIRSTYRQRYLLNFSQRIQKRIFSGDEDGEEILDSIRTEIGSLNGHSRHKVQSICAADVEPTKVNWLWKNRIPLKAYSLMQGIEGIGKSTLLCEVVAAITSLKQIEGFQLADPSTVLWLSAEDDIAEDLVPRLMAAGADLSKVQIIDQAFSLDDKGVMLLKSEIEKYKPTIVIIDPLYAFTKGNPNNEEDARIITNHFKTMSRDFMCAILGVRHINKSKGFGDPRAAGSGSVAWQAAARSVLMVGFDPDNPVKCAMMPVKGNKANWRETDALGYEIRSDITSPSGARFFWTGKSDLSAKKILETASDDEDNLEKKNMKAQMQEFLEDMLSAGPVSLSSLEDEAGKAGLSVSYLKKVRAILNIKTFRKWEGKEQIYYASLPENYQLNGQPKLDFGCENGKSDSDNSSTPIRVTNPYSLKLVNPDFPSDSDSISVTTGSTAGTDSDTIRVTGKKGSKRKKVKELSDSDSKIDLSESLLLKSEPENGKTHCSNCGAKLDENGQCGYC